MSRVRRFVFPMVILGLLALAAFGVWQVVVGPGEAEQPPIPEWPEERQQMRDARMARDREAIQEFVDSGADPCSLPAGEFNAEWWAPYADVPALINDVDLIVLGEPAGNLVEPPDPHSAAGRILTSLQVDDVLSGTAPGPTITVDSADRVSKEPDSLTRLIGLELDACAADQLLLFLERTAEPDVFSFLYQGWARIDADAVDAGQLNGLFDDYGDAQALLDGVRQIAQEQQAQGLVKGLLLCQSKRTSDVYLDPIVCAGDTFNPYRTFQLDIASKASVLTTDPGPSPLSVGQVQVGPGAQLSALLGALDLEVTLQPEDVDPGDLIWLSVSFSEPVNDRRSYTFYYSPTAGIVQMPSSGGQFPAPPEFQQAMEPFLAAP